jgi:hypothetical protein
LISAHGPATSAVEGVAVKGQRSIVSSLLTLSRPRDVPAYRLGFSWDDARCQCSRRDDMETLHRSIFLKELKETFPLLRADINAQWGLPHLEVSVFRDLVQQAITEGDEETVRLSLMMAERYYRDGNAYMSNAICVSFVEHLDLRKAQWAWDLLGSGLKRAYLQLVDAGMARPLPYLSP